MKVARITEDHTQPTNAIFYLHDLPVGLAEVDVYFERFELDNEYLSPDGWQTQKHLWKIVLSEQSGKYRFAIKEPMVGQLEAQLYTLGVVVNDQVYSDFFSWTRFRDTDGPEPGEPEWDAMTDKWEELGLFRQDDDSASTDEAKPIGPIVIGTTLEEAPLVDAVLVSKPEVETLVKPSVRASQATPVTPVSSAVIPPRAEKLQKETFKKEKLKKDTPTDTVPPLAQGIESEQSNNSIKWFLLLLVLILGVLAWILNALFLSDDKDLKPVQQPPPVIEQKEELVLPEDKPVKAVLPADTPPQDRAPQDKALQDTTPPDTPLPTAARPLVAAADEVFVVQGELILVDVLHNDSGEGITITAISNSEFNERSIAIDPKDGRQKIKYLWDNNRTGSEELLYTIRDANGQTAQATVTFTRK